MRSFSHGSTAECRLGWLAAAMLSLTFAFVGQARAEGLTKAAARPLGDQLLFPPPPLPGADDLSFPEDIVDKSGPGEDDKSGGAPRQDDDHQLWLVNTRSLPHSSRDSGQASLAIRRYRQGAGWADASLEELTASDSPQFVTSVLVHGNDTDSRLAVSKGWEVYRSLVRKAPAGQRVRLIVWSWPSDHIPGRFRDDARIKAQRTNIEAYYLARFLDRQRGDNPVSLVGYSFGARVITGALHLLGGGVLEGRRLGQREQYPRPPLHAVLMAAALDRDWLLPGRQHGFALSAVERMVVLVNPQDRVLKWYRFLSPRKDDQALGATGLGADRRLGAHRKKVVEVNVSDAVGNKHGWTTYINSPTIVQRLHQEALVEPARQSLTRSQAGGS
ncbi:MAG TPA: hypothetical protein VHC19_02740 [Pirellulales bacterium]|nr:hypothetical protein [Pirellulales bacterium]